MNKKNILFTLSICLLTCYFNAHAMDKKQKDNGLNDELRKQTKETCATIDKSTAIVKETTRTVENCIATVERTIARLEQQRQRYGQTDKNS